MKTFLVHYTNGSDDDIDYYINAPSFLAATEQADKYAKDQEVEIDSLTYTGESLP